LSVEGMVSGSVLGLDGHTANGVNHVVILDQSWSSR